jgi:hypothetical protein
LDFTPDAYTTGSVRFPCPSTGCGGEVWEFVTLPMADLSSEVHSDGEVTSTENIMCPHCAEQHIVAITATISGFRARLPDSPETAVSVSSDPYDFSDFEPPEDPLREFSTAMAELARTMKNQADGGDGGSSLTRMFFVQTFAVLEAYLADCLIGLVTHDPEARKRVLSRYGPLRELSVPLIEVEAKPTLVLDTVRTRLRAISFHNLTVVDSIFTIATGKSISPADPTQLAILHEARARRHDCVHRNGRNVQGTLHMDIDHAYVTKIISAMKAVAYRVDEIAPTWGEPRYPLVTLDDDVPF